MNASMNFATQAAVLMISTGVASAIGKDRSPSPAEIEAIIRDLTSSSVINGSFDRNGKPTDVYGVPFRVRIAGRTATATSAGPDRLFDTSDDIDRTATAP